MNVATVTRNLLAFAASGRVPSRRAVAALAKLHGRTLERRWPFVSARAGDRLNLGLEDILEFQRARRRDMCVLVVGAYDGLENDTIGQFVLRNGCAAIFVEPQPAAFDRLRRNFRTQPGCQLVNAAIDLVRGRRELFYVPEGAPGLPAWSGQLASFDRAHLERHEPQLPGVSRHIASVQVETLTWGDLLDRVQPRTPDVVQIDVEGVDAAMIAAFPFDRARPGVVHYEIRHMSPVELARTRSRLRANGYALHPAGHPGDEIAVRL